MINLLLLRDKYHLYHRSYLVAYRNTISRSKQERELFSPSYLIKLLLIISSVNRKICVLTKAGEPIEVAHIYPFSMRCERTPVGRSIRYFWNTLNMFWFEERVNAWYAAIFSRGTETSSFAVKKLCRGRRQILGKVIVRLPPFSPVFGEVQRKHDFAPHSNCATYAQLIQSTRNSTIINTIDTVTNLLRLVRCQLYPKKRRTELN